VTDDHRADPEVVRLLTEVRDLLKVQGERQVEALAIQKERGEMLRAQQERATALADRAEATQLRAAGAVNLVRRFVPIVLVLVGIVIVMLMWVLLRYLR
jgi:hypothetical protein